MASDIWSFFHIRQVVHVSSPVHATKWGDNIIAVGLEMVGTSSVFKLVAPCGTYTLPDVCHVLVADEKVYAAGRGKEHYSFVLPPGVKKPVFGARGVYEKGGQVWYRPTPDVEAVPLFPSPLLLLECRNGIVVAASHFSFAVIRSGDVSVHDTKSIITSVGVTGEKWYVTKVAKDGVVVLTENGERKVAQSVDAVVVGDVIIGYDRHTTIIFPDGRREIGSLIRPVRGLDDSFLVLGQDFVAEVAVSRG